MEDGACALMALVAYGASDIQLHGNPERSIYDKRYTRITNSQFTYMKRPFTEVVNSTLVNSKLVKRAHLSSEKDFKMGDLIGECFLDLTFDKLSNSIYDSIESIKFCMGERTLEALTGETLKVMAQVMPDKNELVCEGNHAMVPLPFFFTRSMRDYLPVVEKCLLRDDDNGGKVHPEKMHVDLVLSPNSHIISSELVFKAVVLDTYERNTLHRSLKYGDFSMLTCVSETLESSPSGDSSPSGELALTLPDKKATRDIFIKIEGPGSDAVDVVNVVFNGHLHMSLSRLMAARIIPRQSYGIKEPMQQGMYIIPFCQDPMSETFSTNVNLARIEQRKIVLKFNRVEVQTSPKENKVSVVVRRWDTLTFENGAVKW